MEGRNDGRADDDNFYCFQNCHPIKCQHQLGVINQWSTRELVSTESGQRLLTCV